MINFRSQGFKRYFLNTSWMMSERVLRIFVTFFVVIYVARYLGPEHFGLLSYALSFTALFSAVATLGLDQIVVRNLVQDSEMKKNILGTALFLKITGSLFLIFLIYIAMQLTAGDNYTKILIMILALGMLFQSFNVIDFYFESQVIAKFSSYAKAGAMFGSSMLKIWLVYIKAPLLWFAWAFVLEHVLLAIFLVILYNDKKLEICRWQFEKKLAFKFLHDSWPLILSGFAIMVYMRIDQVMIKAILDSKSVGNYAVAAKISEAFYFIPLVICSSLFPAIIKSRQENKRFYLAGLQRLYDLMTWLGILIALPTTFFADYLISFLFGEKFFFAAGVLKIHIWACVFVFLGVACGKWFIAENLQRYYFYRTLSGAILNVILNLAFIPKFGIKGAAFSTVISQFSAAYLSMAFSQHSRKNFWLATKSFNLLAAPKRIFNIND
jgi:O-antigen/teichoic acid export membrane protein